MTFEGMCKSVIIITGKIETMLCLFFWFGNGNFQNNAMMKNTGIYKKQLYNFSLEMIYY